MINFEGKKLTIANSAGILFLTDGMGEIVVNNADQSITVPTGGTLVSLYDIFDDPVVIGKGDFSSL